MNTKEKSSGSRHGKHKPGAIRLGMYVDLKKKAIAVLTADVMDLSLTDVLWTGIESVAIRAGILNKDGTVSGKYREALDVVQEIIKKERGVK